MKILQSKKFFALCVLAVLVGGPFTYGADDPSLPPPPWCPTCKDDPPIHLCWWGPIPYPCQ